MTLQHHIRKDVSTSIAAPDFITRVTSCGIERLKFGNTYAFHISYLQKRIPLEIHQLVSACWKYKVPDDLTDLVFWDTACYSLDVAVGSHWVIDSRGTGKNENLHKVELFVGKREAVETAKNA